MFHFVIETSDRWERVTSSPICYGAIHDSYATFQVKRSGKIKAIKLQHVSGSLTCKGVNPEDMSYWSCISNPKESATGITNNEDTPIFPASFGTGSLLEIEDHQIPEIILRTGDLQTPYYDAVKGEILKVWYYEDFIKGSDHDNSGTHCVNVNALYC